MWPKNLSPWLMAGWSGLCLAGCESPSVRHPYPDDPLLLYQRPVEGRIARAQPRLAARAEPTPPPVPPPAYASALALPPAKPQSALTMTDNRTPRSTAANAPDPIIAPAPNPPET